MSSSQTYQELKEELAQEQSNKSYEQIRDRLAKNAEFLLELDNIPSQKHTWTDRGLKYTCENAGHPYHEVWRTRKATV